MKRILVVLISSVLFGAANFTLPRDAALHRQAADAVQAALSDGNYAKELREFRRLLEVHPNDPRLKAYFYQAMGAAAEKAGQTKDAQLYKTMARTLDWGIDWRVGKPDDATAIMGTAMQSLATIQKERADAKNKPGPMATPQQSQSMFKYPQAPAGTPAYAPPAQPQPMPGYAAAATSGPIPMPSPNSAPPPFPQSTPGQARSPQNSPPPPPPQFQPNPGAQPPPGFPQPIPQNQQSPNSQGPPPQFQGAGPSGGVKPPTPYVAGTMSGGTSGGPQIGYMKPNDPYIMERAAASGQSAARGEAAKPMRVVHDHSQLGDKAYFEAGCGALLTVEGGALIYTSGVEAPRSIAASEIIDLRMNVEIGRTIGAFHIQTRRGLYLILAPEAATREQGRLFVEALRKQLGLGE